MSKYGIGRILTKKGLSFLIDKDRFRRNVYFPLFILHSAVNLFIISFDLHWENRIWPITPFADTRLVQVARGIPGKGVGKTLLKQKVWEKRGDIFTKGIFRRKNGTEAHYSLFIFEKKNLIFLFLKTQNWVERVW